MKQTIVILTGSSLCHNPRVFKEATLLAEGGFDVEVLGAWLDADLKKRDLELLKRVSFRFTPVLDATIQKFYWVRSRSFVRAAQWWRRCTGRETAWLLGYTVGALVGAARRREADLFIAHSEPAMFSLFQNSSSTLRLGVDMEDWFSEDVPSQARMDRPVSLLRNLEESALRQSVHSTCTSQAMSAALAAEFRCRPPCVVYNAFPWSDRDELDHQLKDRRDREMPSLHWYSQTLGRGRGLEELFSALPQVEHPFEIHLRGRAANGFIEWLFPQIPEEWCSRVFIHGLVDNEELLSRISEHDIGFAGEQIDCRSRDLTVTNKILHYLLGGLAVVASDTAGQREVAAQAGGAVLIYKAGDPRSLAEQLNLLLGDSTRLREAKRAALRAAEQTFCWERQSPSLLDSVERVAGMQR